MVEELTIKRTNDIVEVEFMKRFPVTVVLVGLVLAGCDAGPAEGAGGTIAEPGATPGASQDATDSDPGAAADPSAADDAGSDSDSALGTRDNPAPIGATAGIGEWDVTITEVDRDGAAAVLAENQFNDGPEDGRSFVLWAIDAVYNGEDSGTAWIDLNWKIVGAAGNSFGSGMDDYCGVIPNSLNDKGETFPGGTVSGNVCVSADTDQLDGGTILVEELFGGSRTFFAIP